MSSQYGTSTTVRSKIWLRNYINDHCIHRVAEGDPLLPGKLPGTEYVSQFYLRRGLHDRTFLVHVSHLFWEMLRIEYRNRPFQIAGMDVAGSILLTGISIASASYDVGKPNCFGIRARQKEYGLKNWIEGTPNHLPVFLVDDVSSSKATFEHGVDICSQHGLKLADHAFSIIDKRKEWEQIRPVANLNFIHLFTMDDFDLTVAEYETRATETHFLNK